MVGNLLGTGVTHFENLENNRIENIRIASKAINGTIIKNNREFSFNDIVGERTLQRGYKMANSIDNKKIVKTVGGGICQVSTTIHIAAKESGMRITESHKHTMPIEYASREDEAAVSWNELDFKFLNNTGRTIILESIIDDLSEDITINIFNM